MLLAEKRNLRTQRNSRYVCLQHLEQRCALPFSDSLIPKRLVAFLMVYRRVCTLTWMRLHTLLPDVHPARFPEILRAMREIHSVFSQDLLPREQRVELPLRLSLKIPTYAPAITTTSAPFPGRDMPILPPGASGTDARTPQAADNFPDVLRRRSALPEALPSRRLPRRKFILPHILKKLPE